MIPNFLHVISRSVGKSRVYSEVSFHCVFLNSLGFMDDLCRLRYKFFSSLRSNIPSLRLSSTLPQHVL